MTEDLIITVRIKGELNTDKEMTTEEIQEEILDNLDIKSYNDKYTIYDVEKEIF